MNNGICDESAFYNRMGKVTEIEDVPFEDMVLAEDDADDEDEEDDGSFDLIYIKCNPNNEYLQKAITITNALAVEQQRKQLINRIASVYCHIMDSKCIDERYLALLSEMYIDLKDNTAEHKDVKETLQYIDLLIKGNAPGTVI